MRGWTKERGLWGKGCRVGGKVWVGEGVDKGDGSVGKRVQGGGVRGGWVRGWTKEMGLWGKECRVGGKVWVGDGVDEGEGTVGKRVQGGG